MNLAEISLSMLLTYCTKPCVLISFIAETGDLIAIAVYHKSSLNLNIKARRL